MLAENLSLEESLQCKEGFSCPLNEWRTTKNCLKNITVKEEEAREVSDAQ